MSWSAQTTKKKKLHNYDDFCTDSEQSFPNRDEMLANNMEMHANDSIRNRKVRRSQMRRKAVGLCVCVCLQ